MNNLQTIFDSIMTLNYLTLSKWVLSFIWQAYYKVAKNLFPQPYDNQINILYRFCFKLSLTNFSLAFFPLFSKVFVNICKIYAVPKIYDKTAKT